MFTGFEIIVGLTKRSNAAAVDQLTQHFEGKFPVRGVEVPRGDTCLHLKSLMSAFDEKTILVADNAAGRAIAEKIRAHAHTPELYELVYVPDMLCANVLRIHDTLVVQDGYPASEAVLGKLCEERGVTMMKLCMSGGSAVCCYCRFVVSCRMCFACCRLLHRHMYLWSDQ